MALPYLLSNPLQDCLMDDILKWLQTQQPGAVPSLPVSRYT